jgi:hypothetical protein
MDAAVLGALDVSSIPPDLSSESLRALLDLDAITA